MSFNKLNSRLKWGIVGGFLGGLIAIIGYWILSPSTDSVILFVIPRLIVGSVVAIIVGPMVAKVKSK